MATLDEIFATMPDSPAGGTHEPLVIDPNTREIEIPEIESIFGVASDGNAEKKFFQCPRYVGAGIDLAACRLRIAYQNASNTEEGRDGYLVKDTTVSGEYVYFSWELSPKVCLYNGTVQFAVCAMLGDTVAWHTAIATGTVLEGMEYNGEIIQTEMQDVIAKLLELVETQSAAVEAAGAAAVAKINAAAADTAPAIVCQAEGVAIQVADASDRPLRGLRIFGRSTQDGAPTPDNPVEIVSTPAPVVTVYGKNLLDVIEQTPESAYILKNPGELTIQKATEETKTTGRYLYLAPNTTYTISANVEGEFGGRIYGFWGSSLRPENVVNGKYMNTFTTNNAGIVDEKGKLFLTQNTGTTTDLVIKSEQLRIYNIQVEKGPTATEYEPHKGTQALTMTNALPGIPVASGGNYNDADGQQWICDEVDMGRGVYVQRTALLDFSAWENWNTWGVSANTEGITGFYHYADAEIVAYEVLCTISKCAPLVWGGKAIGAAASESASRYIMISVYNDMLTDVSTDEAALASFKELLTASGGKMLVAIKPTEMPLSEAELATFAALHSVKPTTTILNDSGAHMAVEYVADTKLYIDSKLADLVAAMNA